MGILKFAAKLDRSGGNLDSRSWRLASDVRASFGTLNLWGLMLPGGSVRVELNCGALSCCLEN